MRYCSSQASCSTLPQVNSGVRSATLPPASVAMVNCLPKIGKKQPPLSPKTVMPLGMCFSSTFMAQVTLASMVSPPAQRMRAVAWSSTSQVPSNFGGPAHMLVWT